MASHSNNSFSQKSRSSGKDEPEDLRQLRQAHGGSLATLKELFADWTEEDLLYAIQESGGDLELTILRISDGKSFLIDLIVLVNLIRLAWHPPIPVRQGSPYLPGTRCWNQVLDTKVFVTGQRSGGSLLTEVASNFAPFYDDAPRQEQRRSNQHERSVTTIYRNFAVIIYGQVIFRGE